MKKSIKHPAAFTLIFLCGIFLASCSINDVTDEYNYSEDVPNVAKPEGSYISLMEGNVVMEILEGALSSDVTFRVKLCDNAHQCKFLLQMIRIEPSLEFDKPVTVKLKYDGILSTGCALTGQCHPVVCYWNNEQDYLDKMKPECIYCSSDPSCFTLNFKIEKTGVFAVGDNSKGDFN